MKTKRISIKRKLIAALCSVLSVALTITYLVGFFAAKKETKEVFDAHLARSAKLVFGLIHHEVEKKNNGNFFVDFNVAVQEKTFERYENKTHFQAWKNDEMIYSSDVKLSVQPDYEGFRDEVIGENEWRSFSFFDSQSGIRVLVSERKAVRNELIFDILFSMFLPLVLSFPLLFFIINTTVNRRINPLHRLASKMKKMSTTTLEPFVAKEIPLELKPFIDSFNSLLARLRDALESERRFTDYAAHELRTPLAAIKIQAQLLQKNRDRLKHQEYLDDLLQGIERATHLVNQLLTLARIEPDLNAGIVSDDEINLDEICEVILRNFREKMAQKNISFAVENSYKSQERKLFGNRTYIEVMLTNLIDNAIKYGYENSKILIEIFNKTDDAVGLKIASKGDHISESEIEKIFNNFYRVGTSLSTRQVDGAGLGLAIVKKIVVLHRGTISFHSSKQALNCVEVTLPY